MKKQKKKQRRQQAAPAAPQPRKDEHGSAAAPQPELRPLTSAAGQTPGVFRLDLDALMQGAATASAEAEAPAAVEAPTLTVEPTPEAERPDAAELPEAPAMELPLAELTAGAEPEELPEAPALELPLAELTAGPEPEELPEAPALELPLAELTAGPEPEELPGAPAMELPLAELTAGPEPEELPEAPAMELPLPELTLAPESPIADKTAAAPAKLTMPELQPVPKAEPKLTLPGQPMLPQTEQTAKEPKPAFEPQPLPVADRYATSRFLTLPGFDVPTAEPVPDSAPAPVPSGFVMRMAEPDAPLTGTPAKAAEQSAAETFRLHPAAEAAPAPQAAKPAAEPPVFAQTPPTAAVRPDEAPAADTDGAEHSDDALFAAIDAILGYVPFDDMELAESEPRAVPEPAAEPVARPAFDAATAEATPVAAADEPAFDAADERAFDAADERAFGATDEPVIDAADEPVLDAAAPVGETPTVIPAAAPAEAPKPDAAPKPGARQSKKEEKKRKKQEQKRLKQEEKRRKAEARRAKPATASDELPKQADKPTSATPAPEADAPTPERNAAPAAPEVREPDAPAAEILPAPALTQLTQETPAAEPERPERETPAAEAEQPAPEPPATEPTQPKREAPATPAEASAEMSEDDLFAAIDAILSRNIFDLPTTPAPEGKPESSPEAMPEPFSAAMPEPTRNAQAPTAEAWIETAPLPVLPGTGNPAAEHTFKPAPEAVETPVQVTEHTFEPVPEAVEMPVQAAENAFTPVPEAVETPVPVAADAFDVPEGETVPLAADEAETPAPEAPAEEAPLTLLQQILAMATPVELRSDRRAPVPELDEEPAFAPSAAPTEPQDKPAPQPAAPTQTAAPVRAEAAAAQQPKQPERSRQPAAAPKQPAPRPVRPALQPQRDITPQPQRDTAPQPAEPATPAARPQRRPAAVQPQRPKGQPAQQQTPAAAPEPAPVAEGRVRARSAAAPAGGSIPAGGAPVQKAERKRVRLRRNRREQGDPEAAILHPEEAYRKYTREFGTLGTRLIIVVFLEILSIFFTLYSGLGWHFLPSLFDGGITAYLLLILLVISVLVCTDVWQNALRGLLQLQFNLDALLLVGVFFSAVDTFFAAYANRTPLCAAAGALLCFSLWGKYDEFLAKINGTRILRGIREPIGIVEVQDLMKGHRGIARTDGDINRFMKNFDRRSRNDRVMTLYAPAAAILALILTLVISIGAKTNLFWTGALLYLGAVPMAGFIGFSRAYYRLSRRLEDSDAVLCGWHGAALFGGNHSILVSDADIFPKGSLSINGFKIFRGNPDRIIAYAAAAIHAGGGALDPLFEELLEAHNGRHYPVDRFRHYEHGGIGAEINGDIVLVGTGEFMRRMGVHMDTGMRVQQAAYVSVGGELAGVFALRYSAPDAVARGLTAIGRNRHFKTTLVTRCFLGTPNFLKAKYAIPASNVSYPAIKERLRLSETRQKDGEEQGAILAEDSFGAFAEAAAGGRSLHACATAALLLALACGVIGMILMAVLTALGSYGTVSAVNFLLYLAVWAVPTLLLTGWAERY